MQRWTSERLAVPTTVEQLSSAQLEFAGVRHDGPSFTFYVFLGPDDQSPPEDAGREHELFAAAMTVFAHGDCWGGENHCDWRASGPVSAFDRRPEHHLTPQTLTLDITEALKGLGNPDEITVTIFASRPTDRDAEDVMRFERLSLYCYTAGASTAIFAPAAAQPA
jgi:hypothetical protein